MASAKHGLFRFFHMSRKLALLSVGFLLVLGVSGTAALVFAPASMMPGYEGEVGGHCRTIYQSEFRRGKEKRLIAVIATDDAEPAARIKTGLRIARHLSDTLHPDLVIVQISDYHGPIARAELRGPAIGAEIAYAPEPSRSLAVSQPWEVRYVKTLPTASGLYFGKREGMPQAEIEGLIHEIELVEGCNGDIVTEAPLAVAAGGHEEAAEPAEPAGH
jgi:hypothetical protein